MVPEPGSISWIAVALRAVFSRRELTRSLNWLCRRNFLATQLQKAVVEHPRHFLIIKTEWRIVPEAGLRIRWPERMRVSRR